MFDNRITDYLSINVNFLFILGIILIISGAFLFLCCIRLFHKRGKGTLAPWDPTSQLVIGGIYAYSRNPMITSVLFMLVGRSLLENSSDILVWAMIFFLINNFYFIFYEEPELEKKFGKSYRDYKANVPRWIPRINSWTAPDDQENGS